MPPESELVDLIGSFLAWADKHDAGLCKRLGPKFTEPFQQYVSMLREAIK